MIAKRAAVCGRAYGGYAYAAGQLVRCLFFAIHLEVRSRNPTPVPSIEGRDLTMIENAAASAAPRHSLALRILFVSGPFLLFGGIIAMIVDRAVIAHNDASIKVPRMQTLPVFAYSGYRFPPANPDIADYQLLPVFLGIALVGLLLLIAAITLRAMRLRKS